MSSVAQNNKRTIFFICFGSILFAVVWPFIYPALDYVMALINFGKLPNGFSAIQEIGPIFDSLNPTMPDIFKGMAEASQKLSGEYPDLTSLPYLKKAALLLYGCLPFYMAEVIIFAVVSLTCLLSRLLPSKPVKKIAQVAAIALCGLPFAAIVLWWFTLIGMAYVLAWSSGLVDFLFLIVLFPLVLLRVVSPSVGLLVMALFLVPTGLLFGNEGSMAKRVYKEIKHFRSLA